MPLVSIFGAAGWYFELGPCTQPPLCRWSRLTEPHIGPWVRVFSPVSLGPALSIPFSYRFHLARYQPATNAKAPPPRDGRREPNYKPSSTCNLHPPSSHCLLYRSPCPPTLGSPAAPPAPCSLLAVALPLPPSPCPRVRLAEARLE